MSISRIITSLFMILRMLIRRRIVLILLMVIPAVFLITVELTTSDRTLPFKLASLDQNNIIDVSQRGISLVFFAVASVGFLLSFLGLNLIQKNSEINRRLVICGYHPLDLLASNLLALFILIVIISIYVGILLSLLFPVNHIGSLIFGLALSGFVYGCYGLVIGSLIKGELEGILLIVLLANIDAGWLQNPLFFAEAQNQEIIKYLPAYYPSQSSIIAAFTDLSAVKASLSSLLYGAGFLVLSMLVFFNKMRIRK